MLQPHIVHVIFMVGDSCEPFYHEPRGTPLGYDMVARLIVQTFLGEWSDSRGFISHPYVENAIMRVQKETEL